MLLGVPTYPSCIPTETASTYAAPKSRAARVGTGATSPPSARQRVPISTGSNNPGNAQLARIASTRLPWVITTGSPLFRSVATTAMGICNSSNWRASKTRSIRSPSRWLLAKPSRETRHLAMSRKRNVRHVAIMRASGAPLAYAAPRMLPTLVPAIQDIGMWFCSSTRRTPRCANPRAKPPPKARPIPGRAAGVALSNGPDKWSFLTHRECQPPYSAPMGRTSRKNSTYVLRFATPLKMRKLFPQYFLTSTLLSLYHWPRQTKARFSLASGQTTRRGNAKRIRNVDRTARSPAGRTRRYQSSASRQALERGWRHSQNAHRRRVGCRHLQNNDSRRGRRWHGHGSCLRRMNMNASVPKYVTQGRAAMLLGIPESELSRISSESGLGHRERAGDQEETFFTYEELRKICLMTVHQVH